MKRIITLCLAILITANMFAQVPQKMSYQAVIRNNTGELVTNQMVGMKISILQGSSSGNIVYSETHQPGTNANGLVSVEIGNGTVVSGAFSSINWANGPYFIQTETDPSGGTNYTITGTSQLLSVPYAQYAEKSGNPILQAGNGIVIQNDSIINIGDLNSTNEIQTLTLINDSLKLSQTTGGIPITNITNQFPTGSYLETTSSVVPTGYSFTGKVEAENCNQLIKFNTYIDTNFQDTIFNSAAPNYSFIILGDNIYGASCYMSGNQVVKKFIRYNTLSNTWSNLSSFSKERSAFSMVALNNKIYIIGGDSNIVQYNNHYPVPYVEEYDVATNIWSLKANMPTSRFYCVANVVNDKIFILGGAISFNSQLNYVHSNEVFDPIANSWTQKTSIPTSFNVFYLGTSTSTNIYLKSYTDFNQSILKFLNYNIASDSWSVINIPINEFDQTQYNSCGGLQYHNNKLYGVFNSQQSIATVFEYDTLTSNWNSIFNAEVISEFLLKEANLSIFTGFYSNTSSRVCCVYSTENGSLLCKTFLPNTIVSNLKGNGSFFFINNSGTNKIGLYKYQFPSLLYKYIKN